MFLTTDQIRELTGKVRPSAQARALKEMAIKHGVRPDGSIVVMEAAVDKVLGDGAASKLTRKTTPDFAQVS